MGVVKTIFIALPVSNLEASTAFYAALGFIQNPAFSDESTSAMIWSETIQVMLHTHDKWRRFTARPICPPSSSEVGLSLSCESRAMVDAMAQAAADLGGTADVNPVEDHGFMYGRDFLDPDGHVWGAMWMDADAASSQT